MTIICGHKLQEPKPLSINGTLETMKALLFIIHTTKYEPLTEGDRKK